MNTTTIKRTDKAKALTPLQRAEMSWTAHVNLALQVEDMEKLTLEGWTYQPQTGSYGKTIPRSISGTTISKADHLEAELMKEIKRNADLLKRLKKVKAVLQQ